MNDMGDGCNSIFQLTVTVGALILMVVLSIVGVSSMGIGGLAVGPVVVLIGWIVLSGIFS